MSTDCKSDEYEAGWKAAIKESSEADVDRILSLGRQLRKVQDRLGRTRASNARLREDLADCEQAKAKVLEQLLVLENQAIDRENDSWKTADKIRLRCYKDGEASGTTWTLVATLCYATSGVAAFAGVDIFRPLDFGTWFPRALIIGAVSGWVVRAGVGAFKAWRKA